jgi:plasmid maintenance system antidote protein VapI
MDYNRIIEELGLKKVYVAKKIGITKVHFSYFLHGKRNMSPDKMEKLHQILGIKIDNTGGRR